jgi:hypothetical protein
MELLEAAAAVMNKLSCSLGPVPKARYLLLGLTFIIISLRNSTLVGFVALARAEAEAAAVPLADIVGLGGGHPHESGFPLEGAIELPEEDGMAIDPDAIAIDPDGLADDPDCITIDPDGIADDPVADGRLQRIELNQNKSNIIQQPAL